MQHIDILLVILILVLRYILGGKVEIIFNKFQSFPMTHQFFDIHVHGVHLAELIILLLHLCPSKRGV
jgi:hypothetical protein